MPTYRAEEPEFTINPYSFLKSLDNFVSNYSVLELSQIVKEVIGDDVEFIYSETQDNRSYHISSEKISRKLNFKPTYSIKQAVIDLKKAFEEGLLKEPLTNDRYFNIKMMQKINLQ